MENRDLKWIKKHYGEKFSRLCRELFPTLLETEGLLKNIISESFPVSSVSRDLYNDLIAENRTMTFKNFIYEKAKLKYNFDSKKNLGESEILSPEELMDRAGYILYPECQSEEDIQSFRHYYYRGGLPTPVYTGGVPERYYGEELCTFNGGRLDSCRVWFAVKKNVDEINRKDFTEPRREDDYGISVISIQFSRSTPNTLSIKNRYNHSVRDVCPDATYGNNLDNIIEGLSKSFAKTYNLTLEDNISKAASKLEIPGYVCTKNNKYYKYNYQINGIYFCPNNVIVKDGEEKVFDKNKYIIFDYFMLDIENKTIINYGNVSDGFLQGINKIKDIKRIPGEKSLTIQITPEDGETIEIKLNENNVITGYRNPNITYINDDFLSYNKNLELLDVPKVTYIGNRFLHNNKKLTNLDLSKVKHIGNDFLSSNDTLQQIDISQVEEIGDNFLLYNKSLKSILLPKVKRIGDRFLCLNESLQQIDVSQVEEIGNHFLNDNKSLISLFLPNLKRVGYCFVCLNKSLQQIDISQVEEIGGNFLSENNTLNSILIPNAKKIGNSFLRSNSVLQQIDVSQVEEIGDGFLRRNNTLNSILLPNARKIGNNFLRDNKSIKKLDLSQVLEIGNEFLQNNNSLEILLLPQVRSIGDEFLYYNDSLQQLDVSKVEEIGKRFLSNNNKLPCLIMPCVKKIGDDCLMYNYKINQFEAPQVEQIGKNFLSKCYLINEINTANGVLVLNEREQVM